MNNDAPATPPGANTPDNPATPDTPQEAPSSSAATGESPGGAPGPGGHERCLEEIAALKEQLLRRAAEFENYRRRTRDEQADLVRYATERLLFEQLPVIDDLRRSLAAGREHPDFETFYAGIELVTAKWMKTLAARGLRPMESVGQPFDVDLHDALLQRPSPGAAPGTVVEEIETGYMLHDRVLRHAKVIVAADAAADAAGDITGGGSGEQQPS